MNTPFSRNPATDAFAADRMPCHAASTWDSSSKVHDDAAPPFRATPSVGARAPAPGASSSYIPFAASAPTSRKGVPGSSSRSTRSRGSSFPRST